MGLVLIKFEDKVLSERGLITREIGGNRIKGERKEKTNGGPENSGNWKEAIKARFRHCT